MRKPGLFRRFFASPKGDAKHRRDKRTYPKLNQPFKAPKAPSEMVFIRRWKGYHRSGLLTILRHWPLRTNYFPLQKRPLFLPLFWGRFRLLQGYLVTRYPREIREGSYRPLSLPLVLGNLPLLDMVWETEPRGFANYLRLAPTPEEKFSLEGGEPTSTPSGVPGQGSPQSPKPSPLTPRQPRRRKFPLLSRLRLFHHRLSRGEVPPGAKGTQSIGRTRERPKGLPQMRIGVKRVLLKLKEEIWSKRDSRRGVYYRSPKFSPPVIEGEIPQMQEGRGEIASSEGQELASQPQLISPVTRRERPRVPIGRPSLPTLPDIFEEKPREKMEKIGKPLMELEGELHKGRKPLPLVGLHPLVKASLLAKRFFAKVYPKSPLIKAVKPKLKEGRSRGKIHYLSNLISSMIEGKKRHMAPERGAPLSPSPPQREDQRRMEGKPVKMVVDEGLQPSGLEGGRGKPTFDQVRISTPRQPLADQVFARLYPKKRGRGKKLPKAFEGFEVAFPIAKQLGGKMISSEPGDLFPSGSRPPLITKVMAWLSPIKYRIGKRGWGKRGVKPGGEARPSPREVEGPPLSPFPVGGAVHSKPVSKSPTTKAQVGGRLKEEIERKVKSEGTKQGRPLPSFPPPIKEEPPEWEEAGVPQPWPMTGPAFLANQAAFRALAQGSGIPLDMGIRRRFESFFGMGLEEVRVHTGARAAEVTRLLGAEAASIGEHIFLSPRVSFPLTEKESGLLAHELSHIVQGKSLKRGRGVSVPWSGFAQPPELPPKTGGPFYSLPLKVGPQKRAAPSLMAAPLQRATPAPAASPVRAQITGVSTHEEEVGPKESLEEVALQVYERIKRRLQNEMERLPG